MDGGMHTHRVHAAEKTAMPPDKPFTIHEWQGHSSPRQRAKVSADRRAGKVDLIERALGVVAISSLLRVRALEP